MNNRMMDVLLEIRNLGFTIDADEDNFQLCYKDSIIDQLPKNDFFSKLDESCLYVYTKTFVTRYMIGHYSFLFDREFLAEAFEMPDLKLEPYEIKISNDYGMEFGLN